MSIFNVIFLISKNLRCNNLVDFLLYPKPAIKIPLQLLYKFLRFKNIYYLICLLLRANFLQLVHIVTTQSIKNGVNRFYGGFTLVLPGNFTFANPMISMSFKGQNQEVLLSGNEKQGINLVLVQKNWFHIGFIRESCNLFARDLDIGVSNGGKNLSLQRNRRELNFSTPSKINCLFF